MADFPTVIDFPNPVISTASVECPAASVIVDSGNGFTLARAWVAANLALYMPILIGYPTTVVKMFWVNGSTVGTNHVDVGIYDSQGNQLVHSGSTLTAGASAVQSVSITSTTLEPGLYYIAMASDATTDTFQADNSVVPVHRATGVYEQATAFPLPSPASFTGSTHAYLPFIAMTTQSTV